MPFYAFLRQNGTHCLLSDCPTRAKGTYMTAKEAVPKSMQSKRNSLDYPIATSLITEFTPKPHRAISIGMVSAA